MYRAMITLVVAGALGSSVARAEAVHGTRIEAIAGYDASDIVPTSTPNEGATYGLRAGYDVALGSSPVSLGLEAEVTGTTSKYVNRVETWLPGPLFGIGTPFGVTTTTTRLGRTISAGARLTWTPAERLGVYLAGGYANTRVDTCVDQVIRGVDAPCATSTLPPTLRAGPQAAQHVDNRDGFRVAGGARIAVSRRLFTSLEYRYTRLEGGLSSDQVALGLGIRL